MKPYVQAPPNSLWAILIILSLSFFHQESYAQWNIDVRIGANINLNRGIPKKNKKLMFPGIKIYGSCILNKSFKDRWIGNYGATLAIYSKSLGNDLSPLNNDLQIDFINTFSWGVVHGDSVLYDKLLRTINNAPSYNIRHNYDYAFIVSTNFIINNHKRFQTLGSYSGTIQNFSFNYSNDSGPVIEWLPISDNMDRWWSGIVGLFFHTKENFNRVELSFDQFTGYSPLVYELTSIFGINIPKYRSNYNRNFTPRTFNASAYNVKIHLNQNVAFDIGVNGSLSYFSKKRGKNVYWSLQDALHIKRGDALHPSSHNTRFHFGITTNRSLHQQTLE